MSGQAEREDDSDQPARPRRKRRHRLVKVAVLGGTVALLFNEDVRSRVLDALFGAEEEFDYNSVTEPESPATPPHGGSPSEPWVRSTPYESESFVEPDQTPEPEQDEPDAPEPDLDARDSAPDAAGETEPDASDSEEDSPEPELNTPDLEPDAEANEPDAEAGEPDAEAGEPDAEANEPDDAHDAPEPEVYVVAVEPETREPEPDATDSESDDELDAADNELNPPVADANGAVVVIASEDAGATDAPPADGALRPTSSISPSPAAWHAAHAVEEEHDEPEVEAPPAQEPAAAKRPPDPPRGWFTPSSSRVEPQQG
jgi:hypothetical protein